MHVIGDKWALLIIRDIMFRGKCYYGDFADSEEGMASDILADRFKRLERQGIIRKSQDKNSLVKKVYSLTN